MSGFWERNITFRGRECLICREGDGNWWIVDSWGNEIMDLTPAETTHWSQYIHDWRSGEP